MRSDVRFWDKMLPDQHEHAHLYKGDDFMRDLFQTICRSSGIPDPRDEFTLQQSDLFTVEEMASNPVAMQFLRFLIRVAGVKRILEIGAFIGFSAMSFAKALPDDGEVVSIEKFDQFAAVARRNFEQNDLVFVFEEEDPGQVAKRARERWQARGGGDGNAEEDWFAAERELLQVAGAATPVRYRLIKQSYSAI